MNSLDNYNLDHHRNSVSSEESWPKDTTVLASKDKKHPIRDVILDVISKIMFIACEIFFHLAALPLALGLLTMFLVPPGGLPVLAVAGKLALLGVALLGVSLACLGAEALCNHYISDEERKNKAWVHTWELDAKKSVTGYKCGALEDVGKAMVGGFLSLAPVK